MVGFTIRTAFEIFTNLDDLEITVGQGEDGKFAFHIFRGPEHNFKLLLSSGHFTNEKEVAIKGVQETLISICDFAEKRVAREEVISSGCLDVIEPRINRSEFLNPDLIDQIGEELRKCRVASTYKFPLARRRGGLNKQQP